MAGRMRRVLVRGVVVVAAAYVGLAIADAVLRLTPANVHVGRYERNRAAAEAAGVSFDTRTGWEVIRDLREAGRRAFPFVTPAHFQRGDLPPIAGPDGARVLPLGGISDVTTVVCNETGTWMVYRADEHGFNNPPGSWATPPAIVAVGDSFAHGTCLPRGEEFVSLLRAEFGSVLGVATHGSGPLAMLAQVREYAAAVRPPVVLWFYYEGNDLTTDVRRELRDPTLARYLEPGFSQRLIDRQRALDRAMVERIGAPGAGAGEASEFVKWVRAAGAVVTLKEVRALVAKAVGRTVRLETFRERWFDEQYAGALERFGETIERARDEVDAWGGRLVFVYLPSWDAFRAPWMDGVVLKEDVLAIVEAAGIPAIDVEPAFRALGDPREAFVFGLPNHYGPAGNRAVADAVIRGLRETNTVPGPVGGTGPGP